MSDSPLIERIVLVGFLGSGKSAVGRALAERLDWGFVDFDEEIRGREGAPISEVVAERGRDYFDGAEGALTAEVAGRAGVVVAPGGAWITRPELLESLGAGSLVVWLRVSPPEAYERMQASNEDHPWHDHPSPLDEIGPLMREREPLFRRADLSVPTNRRPPAAIAFEIEQVVRTRGCVRG